MLLNRLAAREALTGKVLRTPSKWKPNFAEYSFRNCLENSRRPLERAFLPPRGCRSTTLRPLLGAFEAMTRDPFRFSKQFLNDVG